MRTEKQMFDLILNIAKEDKRIKAVVMNGSRVNPNANKDIFQDFDIVYVVKETKSFINDKSWINIFGDISFMQYPDENIYYKNDIEKSYGYLMQFTDGNRIDLHINTLEKELEELKQDKLYVVLLDKDNRLPKISKPSDEEYWVKKPTEDQFKCTCNEFWWCLNNVAKGLWREEVPYVQDMLNYAIRPQLVKILSWKIGIETNFSCSIGKSGKYMYRWLTEDMWNRFLSTYANSNINEIWKSVMQMCKLFNEIGKEVSEKLSYKYNKDEAKKCFSYLNHIMNLPKDVEEIY